MKTITYDETKWKLVPVEPTPYMMHEGLKAADEAEGWDCEPLKWTEQEVAYKAMLAAAPAAPVEAPSENWKARAEKAERSLISAGYTDHGGTAWKPPLGPRPVMWIAPSDLKNITENGGEGYDPYVRYRPDEIATVPLFPMRTAPTFLGCPVVIDPTLPPDTAVVRQEPTQAEWNAFFDRHVKAQE